MVVVGTRLPPAAEPDSFAGALSLVRLFAGLTPAQLADVARVGRRHRYRRGQVVFYQGDPGDALYLILSGQVKVSVTSRQGEEAILAVLGAGECFGELALLDDQPRSATIETTQPTEAFIFYRPDFYRFLRQAPDVAIALLRVLAARLRATDKVVEDSAFLDIPERVAKKLLALAAAHGRSVEDGTAIDLNLSQQELASMIGATRESVNKALSYFRDRGILSIGRQRITIRRPEALWQRSGR